MVHIVSLAIYQSTQLLVVVVFRRCSSTRGPKRFIYGVVSGPLCRVFINTNINGEMDWRAAD